jgi:tetratricopeptide (TPR) repeat protein
MERRLLFHRGCTPLFSTSEIPMRKALLLALLPLMVVSGIAGCSRDPEKAKRAYVASGEKYVAQKKYAEAAIEFRNAVAIDPRFGEARFKLAAALEAGGDALGALGEYVRAADLMPTDPKVQLAAGQRLLIAGKYPEARARASAILQRDPKDVTGLILMGNALAGLKD